MMHKLIIAIVIGLVVNIPIRSDAQQLVASYTALLKTPTTLIRTANVSPLPLPSSGRTAPIFIGSEIEVPRTKMIRFLETSTIAPPLSKCLIVVRQTRASLIAL